jgi:hypothetical protein
MQLPPMPQYVVGAEQTLPHVPQLKGSFARFTQKPLQQEKP